MGDPYLARALLHKSQGRPTTELTREGGIICAKDLRAGGTWMGLNEHHGELHLRASALLLPLPSAPPPACPAVCA